MSERNVTLPAALDRFVEERVGSGAYRDANEVMAAGVRLLKAEEETRAARLAALASAVREGVEAYDAGDVEVVEWDALGDWLDGVGRQAERA